MKHPLDDIARINLKSRVGPFEELAKLVEETGELASALLCQQQVSNRSASSTPNVLEEAVDAAICAFSVAISMDFTKEEITNMWNAKLIKWEKKIEERANEHRTI